MKTVSLTNSSKVFLVDDEDYNNVTAYKWWLQITQSKSKIIYPTEHLHQSIGQFILKVNSSIIVDHKNRNPFDNQKCNLRIATASQNSANQGKQRNNTSGYKGVSWNAFKKKWQVDISVQNKHIYVGSYIDKKAAAQAYNAAALKHFGEYAYQNEI